MNNHSSFGDIAKNAKAVDFLSKIEYVNWFSNLGSPINAASQVDRIFSWEEWPGPDDPSVLQLNLRQQSLHDEIMSAKTGDSVLLHEFWNMVQNSVVDAASKSVPYDINKDAWFPPNAAVWHAAWTAALVGVCNLSETPMPRDIAEEWKFFCLGHWPCAWADEYPRGHLVVY